MALIKPRTSYINSSMKFCLNLENANSKNSFWNTISDNDDSLVGGRQLLFPDEWSKNWCYSLL